MNRIIFPAIAVLLLAGGCKKETAGEPGAPPANKDTLAYVLQQEPNVMADNAINSFNKTFLVSTGSLQYYKAAIHNTEKDYFWCQALDIQMMEDTYLRTKSPEHKALINALLNTFMVQNAGSGGLKDWNWNEFNDDVLWAGLAFARGYQITGNTTFLNMAIYAFDRTYDRGWDQQLGGGIWWDIRRGNKSGLSNNTSVMLGCYLYECTKNAVYLDKATAVYNWIRANLFNASTGAVYEEMKADGTVNLADNVYNSGAFISAANHLHRLTGRESLFDDAKLAVDYVVNNKTVNGVMSRDHRIGTWQSEFARGLGEFVRDNNLWSTYYAFMRKNADAAWNARRADLNVSWNQWAVTTPQDDVTNTLECVSAVVMIQVTPATQPGIKAGATYRFTPAINPGSALSVGSSNAVNIRKWNQETAQRYQLTDLGKGYYRLVPVSATGSSLEVSAGNTANGAATGIGSSSNTAMQAWKLVYDYDGYYKLKPKNAPGNCLVVSGGKQEDGTPAVLWRETYTNNEKWLLQLQ